MRAASGMEIVGVLLRVAVSDEACQQVRVQAEGDSHCGYTYRYTTVNMCTATSAVDVTRPISGSAAQ